MIPARVSRLGWLLLVLVVGLGGSTGLHADARVINVHAEVREEALFLDADLELSLGSEVIDALRNSIALTLVVEAEIAQPREWLWDRPLLSDRRRLRLEYHALSRTWMVTDFHARETHTFSQLSDAVESLSRVRAWRLGGWAPLADKPRLLGKLRVRLDVNKLPLPLRVPALFDDNWDLDSDWFLWGLSEVRR
ncbi:DUF4390 domain-containing protein [Guyparkeria halophila]|uniref:DUF4390 domain-containing protein n=1 Tax=Guyparkeria halophila TaxID=47960 RepID=A0A6I6D038_9GAMM|nr:DUF4390 domain-containing protein [Guyparkeria halophila]